MPSTLWSRLEWDSITALACPVVPGGEEQDRQVVRFGPLGPGLLVREALLRLRPAGQVVAGVQRQQPQPGHPGLPGALDHRALSVAHDAEAGPRLGQDLADLVLLEQGVQGHDHGPRLDDGQVGQPPLGTVLALDGHPVARDHPLPLQQGGEGVQAAGGLAETPWLPARWSPAQEERRIAVLAGREVRELREKADDGPGRAMRGRLHGPDPSTRFQTGSRTSQRASGGAWTARATTSRDMTSSEPAQHPSRTSARSWTST